MSGVDLLAREPALKAVFEILWRQECYNGVSLKDVDDYRIGGRYDMGGRVEQYERKAQEILKAVPEADFRSAVEPWADYHGDLPDYDHPLRCVFESGIEYAVQLLAKTLGVKDYRICDGTEEFDGDLGGTLHNIVLAAMPKDEHGDEIWPNELPDAITREELSALRARHQSAAGEGESDA